MPAMWHLVAAAVMKLKSSKQRLVRYVVQLGETITVLMSIQVIGEIGYYKGGVYTLDFSPDSKMLAVGGSSSLEIFEMSENK